MLIYIFNLYFVLFMLLISRSFSLKSRNILTEKKTLDINYKGSYFILLSFLSMFLISGLRYNVGTDYNEYVNLFHSVRNLSLNISNFSGIEPIFIFLVKVIALFSENPLWLFIITSFFITYFIYKAAIKSCNLYELSIFLFIAFGFYTNSLNIVRQWMAISVLVYGYSFLEDDNKKFWKYVLFGVLCHYTALIIIPVFFIIKKMKKNSTRIIIMICGVILFYSTDYIIRILQYISLNVGILNKYYKYLLIDEDINGSVFVLPMFCLITYLLYLIIKKQKKYISEKIELNINILVFAFIFSLIGQKLMIFNRLQLFFVVILIIVIPQLIFLLKKKELLIIYWLIVLLGSIFLIYGLNQNGGMPLPYRTIFL